jgi:antitoxin HicB
MEAKMARYTYRAVIEPGEGEGVLVVSFPDVPGVVTDGVGREEAMANASDALGLMLLAPPDDGRPMPAPTATLGVPVSVPAEVAAKLLLIEAFRASGLTRAEYARRLNRDPKVVRRLLDPMHGTPIAQLDEALRGLGRRLVLDTEDVAAA